MTARGWFLLLGGSALVAAGWRTGWPELTVLGACAAVLVVLLALTGAGRPAVDLELETTRLSVVRGEPATARVVVRSSGRLRRMRLVSGQPQTPEWTLPLKGLRRGGGAVQVPVDTSRRGEHPLGPYQAVKGDAWAIVRRVVGVAQPGTLVVRPRTHPVRRGFASTQRIGESDATTRQAGDDHFFALRDYVLGDEPRNVHWRSSARSGHLVVKQRVAAATDGVLVVLDVDAAAYPSTDAFSEAFVEERFEQAVEVVASLCKARSEEGMRVQFATTARAQVVAGASGFAQILDALAAVQPVPPVEVDASSLASTARRCRCTSLLVVSGDPSTELMTAVRRASALAPLVVRVGGTGRPAPVRVLDVPHAGALT